MNYKICCLTVLLLTSLVLKAQYKRDTSFIDKALDNKLTRISLISLPLFLQGVKMNNEKIDFSNYRRIHQPNFSVSIDDYTQYFPLALTFGLKLSGVKSNSSWAKLFSMSFLAFLLDYGTVSIMKKNIYAKRPDISGNNSFPSGHTSFAFMNAHIFVKEYATNNYLYSTLAYTLASFTGAMRVMNNRHWVADVLAGASIGMFSTELAYYLGDLFFHGREKNKSNFMNEAKRRNTFMGLTTSYNYSFNNYSLSDKKKIKFLNGGSVGTNVGYFYNKYIGNALSLDYSNYRYYDPFSWSKRNLSFYYVGINQYFSLPIHSRIILNSNWGVGYAYSEHYTDASLSNLSRQNHLRYEMGGNITLVLSNHTSLSFFASYTRTNIEIEKTHFPFKTLNIGNSIALTF